MTFCKSSKVNFALTSQQSAEILVAFIKHHDTETEKIVTIFPAIKVFCHYSRTYLASILKM